MPNCRQGVFFYVWAVSASFLLFHWGCSGFDAHELELLKKDDPRFSGMVEKKDELSLEMNLLKEDLLKRKSEMEEKTRSLRDAFRQGMESQTARINEIQESLGTNKGAYRAEAAALHKALEARREESKEVEKAIEHVRDILFNKSTLGIGGDELKQWESRLKELEARQPPLREEIERLSAETSLMKKKIRYL